MIWMMLLILSWPAQAYRLNTSNGAHFAQTTVKFYVTSNADCTQAGVSATELLSIAKDAADKFWNRVGSSRLRLKSGGLYTTNNSLFNTGILCPDQPGSSCPPVSSIPYVPKLLITCNSNSTDNFPSDDYIAISAPTFLSGDKIRGSVILINDTPSSPFAGLSRAEKVNVLAHELGHAVGLGHTPNKEALMYYQNADKIMRLSQDDIDGISYLYPHPIDNCGGIIGSLQEPPGFLWQLLLAFILVGIISHLSLEIVKFSRSLDDSQRPN